MSVIWKRPDGSQNADPENFRRITLTSGDTIWVHKDELHHNTHNSYPFQIGGDWTREPETKILNQLANMLDAPDESWESFLMRINDDDFDPQGRSEVAEVARGKYKWVESLEREIKGSTWEINIIQCALKDIKAKLKKFF